MHCYTIIIHWILPPLTGTHKWNSTVSNLWTWVMASIYAQFIYLLPFSLLIYLFLCGSSPLFLRLCSLGYNVSDKHFSSPDKSFVWRYLFCEIVLPCVLTKCCRTETQTHTHFRQHPPLPNTLSLFPAYPIPPFAPYSRKARELFFWDFIEIHLLTPKSLLLFNPTLSKDF